ncbi:hypothetical protein V6C53_04605 [Desulfocurvibacter africanus]|uniref:Uncharacterized protein n=1 Tax=Desulfocurvibacter africanus subsp. africanus str. Walvis Bay TaxID=690850 RepID=F3Z0Q0_DESAF|nr:hypothetical protein [Desulfocurvibacter africanus]EGJ49874.1 hypothetical protein Desaf_1537 [Desulfocurvibacter africanus subsp. africanus str. Walvis Bay]
MERTLYMRLAASAAILALLACLHVPALRPAIVANPLAERLDHAAEEHIKSGMVRAMGAYAVARGINAVVSVIQGSALDVSLLGVGGSVALGQLLDPVDDLVERFSWVILASAMSLGIQLAMIKAGVWLGLSILLSLAALAWLAGAWWPGGRGEALRRLGARLALAALLARFCVPVVAVGGELFFQSVLRSQYEQASLGMERFQEEISSTQTVEVPEVRGSVSRDGQSEGVPVQAAQGTAWDSVRAFSPAKIMERVGRIGELVDVYVENAVTLMVVFTVQTVLLPLAMLWMLLRGFNFLAGERLAGVPRPWIRKSSHRPEN